MQSDCLGQHGLLLVGPDGGGLALLLGGGSGGGGLIARASGSLLDGTQRRQVAGEELLGVRRLFVGSECVDDGLHLVELEGCAQGVHVVLGQPAGLAQLAERSAHPLGAVTRRATLLLLGGEGGRCALGQGGGSSIALALRV